MLVFADGFISGTSPWLSL